MGAWIYGRLTFNAGPTIITSPVGFLDDSHFDLLRTGSYVSVSNGDLDGIVDAILHLGRKHP